MKRTPTVIALLLIDLGVFLGTSAFLPRRGSWGHSGPLSYFINARDRWDIAWGILVASLILSAGVFLLLQASGAFDRQPEGFEEGSDEQ